MNKSSFYPLMFLCLCAGSGASQAALNPKEVSADLRPKSKVAIDDFFKNPNKFETTRAERGEKLRILPKFSPQQLDAYIKKVTVIYDEYFTLLRDGKLPGDVANLRVLGADKSLLDYDRGCASFLVYLVSKEPKDAVQFLLLWPGLIEVFEKVKDPDFGKIMAIMFAESSQEEANMVFAKQIGEMDYNKETGQIDPRSYGPYSAAMALQFHKWIAAAYFQGVVDHYESSSLIWNKAESLRLGLLEPQFSSATDLFPQIQSVSVPAAHDFITFLLEHGRDDDVAAISKKFPDQAEWVRDAVSEYRLATKKRLDQTFPLMRRTDAKPPVTSTK